MQAQRFKILRFSHTGSVFIMHIKVIIEFRWFYIDKRSIFFLCLALVLQSGLLLRRTFQLQQLCQQLQFSRTKPYKAVLL